MTAPTPAGDVAPLPERGQRVLLDGLPGGPWTTLVDGRDDDLLTLSAPRLGGEVVRLPLRRPFLLAYSHREIPCEVDAQLVVGPSGEASQPYVAQVRGTPRRIQRRRAVRVPVHLLAQASIGDDHDDDDAPLAAVTENLSAGGALLRSDQPLAAGSTVGLTIQCGGTTGTLTLSARVVRCDRTTAEVRAWRVAVAFVDMSLPDEDGLVRYVFALQREMRARDAGLA